MSAISNFLTFLRSAIYAIDVRDGIADAIEQCYNDVNNPTLKTEALEAALQTKIDEGEMAALTIGDGTITAAKLASGVIDNTLATSGAAADAKKTGDEIAAVKADLGDLVPGLSEDAKQAMLACFRHLSFLDNDDDYYTNLYDALYPDSGLVRIETVFNQGTDVIYDNTPLNDLKAYLTVTGYYNNGTSKRINDYTLFGTLEVGTSIITVSAGGKTTTFNVSVISAIIHLRSYVFAEFNNVLGLYGNNVRACSTYVSGEHPYPKAYNAESLQGDYYPIPIPQGASSINVNMPNDLYVGIRVVSWTGTYYATNYSSPWLGVNDATLDVSAYNDGMHFVSLSYKSGSEGTTDMSSYDMSGVEITFL